MRSRRKAVVSLGSVVFVTLVVVAVLAGVEQRKPDDVRVETTLESTTTLQGNTPTPNVYSTPSPSPAATAATGYKGQVLAGKQTPYIAFTQEDYDKALKEKKIIVLEFYANWCPICRAQEPEVFAAFNSLQAERVVGFRVNYKDTETDANELKLANSLGIPYQHTKVFLVDGKEVKRSGDSWKRSDYINAINELLK